MTPLPNSRIDCGIYPNAGRFHARNCAARRESVSRSVPHFDNGTIPVVFVNPATALALNHVADQRVYRGRRVHPMPCVDPTTAALLAGSVSQPLPAHGTPRTPQRQPCRVFFEYIRRNRNRGNRSRAFITWSFAPSATSLRKPPPEFAHSPPVAWRNTRLLRDLLRKSALFW